MLLIDGVKYELWTPPTEDEFEREVKKHTQDIFGEQSMYLDMRQKLRSEVGTGSIPDGFVIVFGDLPHWHIVEVELSWHAVREHIVSQVGRFISAVENPSTKNNIVNAIYDEITKDDFFKLRLRKAIGLVDIHKFLADLVSKPPILTIIIEKATPELREALRILRYPQEIKVVEFQTFTREGVGLAVHAHLFEPLYKPSKEPKEIRVVDVDKEIEIKVTPAAIKYGLIPLPTEHRHLFPGFNAPFTLITDIGEITTHVIGAPAGTPDGDPDAGGRIQWNLKPWYQKHAELKPGDKLTIEIIEPKQKYRLEIAKQEKEGGWRPIRLTPL